MNYYQILGVPEDATEQQIAEAYRAKAKLYHPDHNQDEEASKKFKEVTEAFESLNRPDKRSVYDSQRRGFDFFSNMFGHRGPMGRDRTKTIKTEVYLTFVEAAFGCRKEVSIHRKEVCKECDGGILSWKTCDACHGSGRITLNQGPFVIQTTCNNCNGMGKIAKEYCGKCSGKGYGESVEEKIAVDIPAGVDNGIVIQMSGMGEMGREGRRGNLHIVISVMPHPFLTRSGTNLFCRIPVTYSQLIFGDKITVPVLVGTEKLTIPPKTPAGKKLRLKGKGVIGGDLYVMLDLDMPEMNDEYQQAIQKLSELEAKYITSKRKEFERRLNGQNAI